MKPVDMMCLHDPANGTIGDCFRCCIASLLELPAADVPHFMEKDWGKTDGFHWYRELNEWLSARGFAYLEWSIAVEHHGRWFEHIQVEGFDVYHVLSGMSPRGFRHSVVARNGVMVHDPHPSRDGLSGPNEDGYLYGLLVARGMA